MKKICICGHFGKNNKLLNGQTIKTKILYETLIEHYGNKKIVMIDTCGGIKQVFSIIMKTIHSFILCECIIILPAYKGLILFAPMCAILNKIFRRKIVYVVIGGWIAEYLDNHPYVEKALFRFDLICVETSSIKVKLLDKGFKNVEIYPNCKNVKIVKEEELCINDSNQYRFCTFSRVIKEKGIEIAIKAVELANEISTDKKYYLDIYGQIDSEYKDAFYKIIKNQSQYITYKGVIEFNGSTEVIKHYYALLFPTFYSGEGFAGTIIDAMAAGVPVIASDWKYNNEILDSNFDGIILKDNTPEELCNQLMYISNNSKWWQSLKINCINKAKKYSPKEVYKDLFRFIGEE